MAYQLQWRRDLAANWIATDPILAQGEIGLEIDTDRIKIGNGVDVWSLLPYWDGGNLVNDQCGKWASSSTYIVGDIVNYNGDLYVSLQAGNTNQQPDTTPAYWSLFSSGSGSATSAMARSWVYL